MKNLKQFIPIFLGIFLVTNFLIAMECDENQDPSMQSPGVDFAKILPYPLPQQILLTVFFDAMHPKEIDHTYVLSPVSNVLKQFWNIANTSKGMRDAIFNEILIQHVFLKSDLLAKEKEWRKEIYTESPYARAFCNLSDVGPDKLTTYSRCLLVEALIQLQDFTAILREGKDLSDECHQGLAFFRKELANIPTLHVAMEAGHPSAIYLATQVGTLEEIKFLIECGANPNGVAAGVSEYDCPDDGRRYRPLSGAFDRERYDVAEALCSAGADLNVIGWDTISFHGKLLVEYAKSWKHEKMEQWLLERGADPKAERGRMVIGDWWD